MVEQDKMESIIHYAELHSKNVLKDILRNIRENCTSKSSNDFWNREKYFLNLPYDPLEKIIPQKASATLMNRSEIKICQYEIKDLLIKGLIEPSKSASACRGCYFNKKLEQKRGKTILVVNYKPLNKFL